VLTIEVNDRLDKLQIKINKLLQDKQTIEQKMFDCGTILKKLELGITYAESRGEDLFFLEILIL